MGVETDELYTADVTRTLPIDGSGTPRISYGLPRGPRGPDRGHRRGEGRRRLPRRAPGRDVGARRPPALLGHPARARRRLLRRRPGAPRCRACTAATRCTARRTCSASTCTTAPSPGARSRPAGPLVAGHVLTVEPGLYFQVNDRTVPAELRGIGVRIEDDIVVTDGEPSEPVRVPPPRPGRGHGLDGRRAADAGRAVRDHGYGHLVPDPADR